MNSSTPFDKEYLVVGCGIAGLLFCEQLLNTGRSFVVIDGHQPSASKVAGGLYNPVVLKRFKAVWEAKTALAIVKPVYRRLEDLLQAKWLYEDAIYRRIASPSEINHWTTAADEPELETFLSVQFKSNTNPYLKADFGFGEVTEGGRLDIENLLDAFKSYLLTEGILIQENFDYQQLSVHEDCVSYSDRTYKNLVCAEGMGIAQNPYFNQLPVQANKGEYLKISAPDLKLEAIYKSDIFIIPLGNEQYLVGATYNRFDQNPAPTEEAKAILLEKLEALILCDYEVIGQQAGFRPTVPDRRPIIGTHPQFSMIHVLNGFGSRGVLHGPMMANMLYNSIEHQMDIPLEMSLMRYQELF